jgi:hypothetical protein
MTYFAFIIDIQEVLLRVQTQAEGSDAPPVKSGRPITH